MRIQRQIRSFPEAEPTTVLPFSDAALIHPADCMPVLRTDTDSRLTDIFATPCGDEHIISLAAPIKLILSVH